MVADATDGDAGRRVQLMLGAAAGAVAAIDAVLLSAFENGMLGDDVAEIKDTDQVGELLDVGATPCWRATSDTDIPGA
jgi:hypothetical protein